MLQRLERPGANTANDEEEIIPVPEDTRSLRQRARLETATDEAMYRLVRVSVQT
jgi:hypothetical protein